MPTDAPKLTERQERHITRYLKDVGDQLCDIPSRDREAALSKLNTQIEKELKRFPHGIADIDLENVLGNLGSPARQASRLVPADRFTASTFVSWPDRVWLGVCAGIARKLDIDANIVRVIAVLMGLVLPLLPVLFLAYLAIYFWDYFTGDRRGIEPLEPLKVAKTLAMTFGVALALHWGARILLIFVARGYEAVAAQPLMLDRRWSWLMQDAGSWFFWVLALGLPLAAISALPVPKAWAGTLRKTVHAGLAIYAVWLCYGLASVLAGIILSGVDQFSGTEGTDALFSLIR
jgi:phage shock protein PspC (stress-responsive transcriptional regulator)